MTSGAYRRRAHYHRGSIDSGAMMASEIWKGRRFAALGLWLLAATVAAANEAEVAKAKAPVEPPWRVETRHQGQFGGQTLRYTARVGEMQLVDAAGKPAAALCYTAYLVDSDRPRPVSFVFNGGPGSASVWLHMGLLGPPKFRSSTPFSGAQVLLMRR